MRLAALSSIALLAACTSAPAEPPVPADSSDALSVVAAARQCDPADFEGMDMPDIGRPQFEGNPSLADRNQLEGELYIERMNLQPCVYALPSGLHFRILRAMTDETLPSPEASEMVIANYEIRPAEGEIMQSSFATGEPLRGSVGRFIPAWNEALTLMRPGEEWELFVPSALGYGARGIPGSPIGPNQALYFRMELICLPGREDGGCEA